MLPTPRRTACLMRCLILFILLCTGAACQTTNLPASAIPSPTAPPVDLQRQPTLTPRPIDATVPPTLIVSPPPTAAPQPTISPLPPTPDLAAVSGVVGSSVEGKPITWQRFGTGDTVLLLVGGIHGGWEKNTVDLMNQLIDHFTSTPQDVLPGMALVIIPVANPDGLSYGQIPRGRFNGDGVDLNRNWPCDWSRDAFWRQERVNPGIRAFSEPETVALADFMLQIRPAAALFYHSAAGGVFAGNCGGDHGSASLSKVLGQAAGYSYGSDFSAYPVTGTASNWADGQGIASADVELITATDSEYDRNLRGVMAVQRWLLGQ